jgi:hypothetical protein
MKKRSLHRLHICEDTWKWYVKDHKGDVIIFAPTGKRYQVKLYGNDIDPPNITPSSVKDYIINNIKKQDSLCIA